MDSHKDKIKKEEVSMPGRSAMPELPAPPVFQVPNLKRRGLRAILADGRLVAAVLTTLIFFVVVGTYEKWYRTWTMPKILDEPEFPLSEYYPTVAFWIGLVSVVSSWFFWASRRVRDD
jgi:hypothetical protein